jgi:hypothetical protein
MMSEGISHNINSTYVVLDDTGNAIPIAVSDRFYKDLEHQFGDFKGKRLISHYTFEQDWGSWKVPGDYVLVPRGIWHTVRVHTPSSVLFITPGEGTQHRSRLQFQ